MSSPFEGIGKLEPTKALHTLATDIIRLLREDPIFPTFNKSKNADRSQPCSRHSRH